MPDFKKCVIIGGGFAGITAACWASRHGAAGEVLLLEKEETLLKWCGTGPVLLGGSGDDGPGLEADYPRGWPAAEQALLKWPGSATRDWLASAGLPLERAGAAAFAARSGGELRDFCRRLLADHGVAVKTGYAVETLAPLPGGGYRAWGAAGEPVEAISLLLATGGERNHGLKLAQENGAAIVPPAAGYVRLRLAGGKAGERFGPVVREVRLRCVRTGIRCGGVLEFSARGLEGPVVSTLSALAGETWRQADHRLQLEVDWLPDMSGAAVRNAVDARCQRGSRRPVAEDPLFGFTQRQWAYVIDSLRVEPDLPWARLKSKKVQALVQRLKGELVPVAGMGLPAGERAWAGGVGPGSFDWGSGAALTAPGLFFAGEILDILGLPGGPHLNAAWATGYQAGCAMGARAATRE